jgi:hypothetical protein
VLEPPVDRRMGTVLDSPVGRVLGSPVGRARVMGVRLGRDSGRRARKQVRRVRGRTRAATVLEQLVVTRAGRAQVRPGRARVGMSVRTVVGFREVMGGLGLSGLWFWWWRRWLLLG